MPRLLALLAVLAAAEGALRAVRGAPPDAERLFLPEARYLYAESRLPFFRRAGSDWVVSRPRALPASFPDAKAPEELRVFVVGESAARRLGAESVREAFQDAFPNKKVRAIDAGMGTYASGQWPGVLAEVLAHGPDVVVLMAGHNEGLRPDRVWYPAYRANLILRRLWLWRLLQDAVARVLPRPGPAALDARFEKRLRRAVRDARARGVRVVLCTLPVNGDFPPSDLPDRMTPARNARVRRVAAEEGAALADLDALFARRAPCGAPGWESFIDGVHPRAVLHPLIARALARAAAGGPALDPDLVAAPDAPAWAPGPELDELAWSGFSEALQADVRSPGALDARAVAELTVVARADPATLDRLVAGPEPLASAFAAGDWTRPLTPLVAPRLPALRAHADEARRRARAR